MNREEYAAWAVEAWKKGVLKNMPAVKAARQLKAGQRESRKALALARRSLAASQAATRRKLNQRLADLERTSLERREVRDREFEDMRWDLLVGKR